MSRANWCFRVSIVLITLVGCNQGGSHSASASNEKESAPSAAGVAGKIRDEAQARQFAAARINEYISGQKFTDDGGNPLTPPNVEVDTWRQVEQHGERWTLKRGPPGNWYYHTSFDADGANPECEVVYFAE